MYKFMIVLEQTGRGYSAYSPDLPGCVATGSTKEETEQNMYGAIEMHIKGLLEDDLPIPKSRTSSEYVVFKCHAQQIA
ncbi:MAG: type II toxin-antitoxin system HicB family antitoxin [Methanosarcinales archaeon Met12]|nr:MAG: type II toxin-antitoxin system HicB family antitoxin [Methanosarcinales archaeon Met12]